MNLEYASLDKNNKADFFDSLFKELVKIPFGTIGKRDMECLLLYLMQTHGILSPTSNRKMANALCLNEKRLKGYLVDMRYKYEQDKYEENIKSIITDIFCNNTANILYEKEYFIFSIENPIKKLDFFQAMKELGFYADTSFSDEIVKVRDVVLLAFLHDYADDKNNVKFKAAFKKDQELINDLEAITSPGKPVMDFFKKAIKGIGTIVTLKDGATAAVLAVELLRLIAKTYFG